MVIFRYWKQFLLELFRRFSSHNVLDLAAQLSFYFLFALFPFLIFTFAFLAFTPISSEQVITLIAQYVPIESMGIIERNVRSVLDVERGGLLSISIFVALWSASNGSHAIIRALNHAYDVEESRPFLKARIVAVTLTFAMIFAIIIALILPVFGKALGMLIFTSIGLSESFLLFWNILRWLISFTVIFTVFSFLYYVAPNRIVSLNHVWVGAFIATLGWQTVSLGFSFYVSNFSNFTAMYGSLGGVIGLLLWFFLTGVVLILGGEINATREVLLEEK